MKNAIFVDRKKLEDSFFSISLPPGRSEVFPRGETLTPWGEVVHYVGVNTRPFIHPQG
jgi:hypothetical protein